MSFYQVKHIQSGKTFMRPAILRNEQETQAGWHLDIDPAIESFHKQLPHYGETQLHDLSAVAAELGFAHVFVKDESTRFGLPSFKILGASWAVHQAICQRIGLPSSTSFDGLKPALHGKDDVRLVTCSEGNWGRATARMAKYLGVPLTLYVPGFMNEYTQGLLRGEGADVRVLKDGTYDDAIAAVRSDASSSSVLMVMDTSWEGYEQIPVWVTEGYDTMLRETDRQVASLTGGKRPNIVVASVGVGSWAHSVVVHYKAIDSANRIITVEPDTAACFKESLHCGKITSIETADTIMCGMNCGTPSRIAWPILQKGTSAAVTVTDKESHECVQILQSGRVNAGPCGAATLAALKKSCAQDGDRDRSQDVVVLFSTEGMRFSVVKATLQPVDGTQLLAHQR